MKKVQKFKDNSEERELSKKEREIEIRKARKVKLMVREVKESEECG